MPVPGAVATDLAVVQAGLVLGPGETVLDRQPRAGDGDPLGQGAADEQLMAGGVGAAASKLFAVFAGRSPGSC